MKKLCIPLLFSLLLCGCVQRDENGIDVGGLSGYGDDAISVSTVKYGYIEYKPAQVIDYGKYEKLDALQNGQDYLVVYDYAYAPGKDSAGTFQFVTTLTYSNPAGDFDLFEADTTIVTNKSKEDTHGVDTLRFTLTFSVSENKQEYYSQRLVFKLTNPKTSEGQISIRFSTNAGSLTGGGKEGFSHDIKVQ